MRRIGAIGAALTLLVVGSAVIAQDNAADLARALLTIPMAAAVGPSGKVYATDLRDMLAKLRQAVQKAAAQNVEVIEGQPSSSNLPPECCDAIVVRNVYHHFADPAAMNASLWASLKRGGRLAIIDFRPRGREAISPADRAEGDHHGVSPESVTKEVLAASSTTADSPGRKRERDADDPLQRLRSRRLPHQRVFHSTIQMLPVISPR